MEHPQILGLNLKSEIIEQLQKKNFAVYDGSIGQITNLNLVYKTIFDPRAFALSCLNAKIRDGFESNFLLIVFCSDNEEILYNFRDENGAHSFSNDLYSFIEGYLPFHFSRHGVQTKVKDDENELYQFLKKYNSGLSYDIAFQHPTIYQSNKNVPDPDFYPLIYNKTAEIVSFCRFPTDHSGMFFFPKVKEQANFLLEFLDEIAPSIFPALFPKNIKNSWTSYQQYALPNQERLVNEMQEIKNEYEKKLQDKEIEIADNNKSYSFLHEMLTETDTALVKAVIKYFEWLGFMNVLDGDEINTGVVKEEDIQIETDKGLLIFEVKGLGATSKDSDCGQIGKVKYRRAKQRAKFDVFATYIVNHQRHLPPLDRKNPPFTAHQLEDAKNEERGLLTTWQLFNLYFDIEEGIFTKEQVREAFYDFGYIDFLPKSYLKIGQVDKFYQGYTVVIIRLPMDVTLNVNDKILVEDSGEFRQFTVNSIKVDDKFVKSANNIEVGIQFSNAVPKNGILYKVVK